MAHFSSSHTVVAIDLAGHGESGDDREMWTMKAFGEDVAAVARELGLTNVVLIGHSMGTPVILEAALQMPNEIVALVPVDMLKNVEVSYSPDQINRMVENYMAGMENPTLESLGGWFTSRMDSAVINNYVRYCQDSAQQHSIAWEQSLREVFAWMSNEQLGVLAEISTPVICINSARPTTDLETARKYAQSFDVRVIEDVGHSIHWEVPDEFNQVLEGILATLQQ
jgi:pimeloyl-ACP methyl ester carboxylesterase